MIKKSRLAQERAHARRVHEARLYRDRVRSAVQLKVYRMKMDGHELAGNSHNDRFSIERLDPECLCQRDMEESDVSAGVDQAQNSLFPVAIRKSDLYNRPALPGQLWVLMVDLLLEA